MSDERQSLDPIEDLLVVCLERMEREGPSAIDAVCREHPQHAEVLRREIAELQRLGMAAPASPAPAGDVAAFGAFRLHTKIGSGTSGTVWLAEQQPLRRLVALKVFDATGLDPARIEREARALGRLDHRNLARVLASGVHGGTPWIAMELVVGEGLDQRIAQARGTGLPAADVVRWGSELARGLAHAHAVGVVHRDVKPANVRIGRDGRAVLVDFGVAKGAADRTLTRAGETIGSLAYAAPEVLAGKPHAPASDVWALGVTLGEALLGEHPLGEATVARFLGRGLSAESVLAGPARRRVARDLLLVLDMATDASPQRRYATADDLAADLEAIASLQAPRARPLGLVRRLGRAVRRRPRLALAAGLVVLASLVGLTVGVAGRVAARREARQAAEAALVRAGEALRDLRRHRVDLASARAALAHSEREMERRWLTDDERAALGERERRVAGLERAAGEALARGLAEVHGARRLDPTAPTAVLAELCLERWRQAREEGDETQARLWRAQVAAADPGGALAREVRPVGRVTIATQPAASRVFLFRTVLESDVSVSGEPRLVPVPHDGRSPLLPMIFAGSSLRGISPKDALPIDSPGVRPTLAHLHTAPGREVGRAPLDLELEEGEWLALCELEGHEPLRLPFRVEAGKEAKLAVDLLLAGTTPAGFVRIAALAERDGVGPFWIQDHEVTVGDWLRFLEDPSVAAAVRRRGGSIYVPREAGAEGPVPLWHRNDAGEWLLPASWSRAQPVRGIDCADAEAYARWLAGRLAAAGHRLTLRLPALAEWRVVTGATLGRRHVWGSAIRPHWMNGAAARPRAGVTAVLSHPRDESPFGVFDLAGSLSEWSRDTFAGSARRTVLGGSWDEWEPERFTTDAHGGAPPDVTSAEVGFRLVAVRVD